MNRKRLGLALLLVSLLAALAVEATRTRSGTGIRAVCRVGDWATLSPEGETIRIRIIPVEEKSRLERILAEDRQNLDEYRETNNEDAGQMALLRPTLPPDMAGGEFYQIVEVSGQSVTLVRNNVETVVPVSQIASVSVHDFASDDRRRYVEAYKR